VEKIKIALVEDQVLFRKGMSAILGLQPGFEIWCEAENGEDFLQRLETSPTRPQIVLLDLKMPGLNGIEITKILKNTYPDMRILILSVHEAEHNIAYLVELGANGYLSKNSEPDEVIRAIQTIMKSDFYFNDSIIRAMRSGLALRKKMKTLGESVGLTPREREILELICREYTAPEIAEKLFLSVRTVEGHRNNLLLKTGTRNVAGLVIFAIRNDLVNMSFL
jgi:DNA-binding NarL/FixJ family response regulator